MELKRITDVFEHLDDTQQEYVLNAIMDWVKDGGEGYFNWLSHDAFVAEVNKVFLKRKAEYLARTGIIAVGVMMVGVGVNVGYRIWFTKKMRKIEDLIRKQMAEES